MRLYPYVIEDNEQHYQWAIKIGNVKIISDKKYKHKNKAYQNMESFVNKLSTLPLFLDMSKWK